MPDVGSGVMEIRVHGDNEYRVFYVARYEEAVDVLPLLCQENPSHAEGRSTLR